jgi:hypothetical protein
MRTMMWPKRWHLVLALVISLVVYGSIYILAITGEAYQYGLAFVQQDHRVIKVTGQQRSQKFEFWSGFSESVGDVNGSASFTIRISGDNGVFDVPLELQKKNRSWEVVGAKIINANGRALVIVK